MLLALIILWLIVVLGMTVWTARRAWSTFKTVQRTRAALATHVERINAGVAALETGQTGMHEGTAELQAAVARLNGSLAELGVLTSALRDARSGIDRARRYFRP